jgi:hypothetical protein
MTDEIEEIGMSLPNGLHDAVGKGLMLIMYSGVQRIASVSKFMLYCRY